MKTKLVLPLKYFVANARQPTRTFTTQSLADDERISRLTEAELARLFLASPSPQLVIEALYQGCSLQQAAIAASVPANVARKVLALLQRQPQHDSAVYVSSSKKLCF